VGASVQPETILKDLARLWVDLAKEEDSTSGASGVLRACAMTLVVATGERDDPQTLGETLVELMQQHPSRVIVLRVAATTEATLESRVFAQCWRPFGRSQQICCEQVEITASPSRFADLPKLILGLTVPDLPVVMWFRGVAIGDHPEFREVLNLPDRVIVDSSRFEDPEQALVNVRELCRRGWNVGDLEWTRLTPWRESVAHIFENKNLLQFVQAIERVSISHTGAVAPVCARYLASWLTHTLPSRLELSFQSVPDVSGSRIRGIALEGKYFSASLALEGNCVVSKVNKQTQRSAFPAESESRLMREELSISGIDTIFRRCLE
jgi:glucose-6-phosphate dehydrogenase assembly protein OpcA